MIVGELHTLWEQSNATANWIINDKVVMPIQWNVKYAGGEVQGLLIALALFFYKDTKFNRTTAKAVVFYYSLDLLFYFYNYKRDGYGWTYTLTLIVWLYFYNHGKRKRPADRPGVFITA
jgi:hypothetical protein